MVTVSGRFALYVPESFTATVNVYVPDCPAVGAVGPDNTPDVLMVQPGGSEPLTGVVVQVFVPLPPVIVNCCEYTVPTTPVNCAVVVELAISAGTVIVAVPDLLVSATEVAVMVTVCVVEVAAGAVKVAPVVDVPEREEDGAPLTVQVTPSGEPFVLLSLVTVAVSVDV
jgi:hypothetical protein